MKTPERLRDERISHLEYCMEKLLQKDDGYNELEVKRLYTLIYRVVCEMREMNASEALDHFSNNINDKERKALRHLNIELIV